MRLIRMLWPIIIVCSALAALMAMLVFPDLAVRPLLIMWFLFICPGMALVRFLHLKELVDKFALALALSFSIDGIVAGIYLYAGHWVPADILITLAVTSIVAVVIEVTNAHIFVYKHVGLVRSLGTLLTNPVIIGTRSATPPFAGNLAEEATVRVVSVQSISNLLPAAASEHIEEKATLQMANVKASSLAPERFEKQVSPSVAENIEEWPTVQLAHVQGQLQAQLSSSARERFEQQETVQLPTPQSLPPAPARGHENTSRPQPQPPTPGERLRRDSQQQSPIPRRNSRPLPQQQSPIPGKRLRRDEAVARVDKVDAIEEKDTLHIASTPAVPQAVVEDADKTIIVSGPQWMQKQLNITNGGFPEEDDIEKRPTRHIANVPSQDRSSKDEPHPAKPEPVENNQRINTTTPQSDSNIDDPATQRVSKDDFRTNSQQLGNQTEERSPSFANNRSPHKKRLATKFTRIEK